MIVHVVCRNPDEDSVVPRLMRALCESAGWSLGDEPDPGADLNYFGLYIDYAERFLGWRKTMTAAYFSHLEVDFPRKVSWWHGAARRVDARVVTAPMYQRELERFGPTFLCRPCVDPQFAPRQRVLHDPPVVGVAGFVRAGSARKGADLLRAAVRELGRRVRFVATGDGWPLPCRKVLWSRMPEWFAELDAFLCTSRIEGVPMPPLEALAMGVPVIVPRGVGLLDTLPGDVPGIWRYDAGNLEGMCRVLAEFAAAPRPSNPERLRACVGQYTREGWAEDHMAAFAGCVKAEGERSVVAPAVDGVPQVAGDVARAPVRGMYMVAFGEPAREGAATAVAAFRRHMPPDVQVAVASDRPLEGADVFVETEDADVGGRSAKTRMYDLAPREWGQVLYMDADTEVTKPDAAWLFRPLDDGWDMVICTNPGKFHVARRMRRPDNEDECQATFAVMGTEEVLQLNGGVLAFRRNERTEALFRTWHEEWQRWGKRDQAALLRALWRCPVRLFVVGNQWNTILPYCPDDPSWTAGVMHHVLFVRRWTGTIEDRLDSKEAWGRVEQFKARGGKRADYKRR